MAIDSETKRRSVQRPVPCIPVLPVPTGALGDQDRAHIYIYAGITIGEAAGIVAGPIDPIGAIEPIEPL